MRALSNPDVASRWRRLVAEKGRLLADETKSPRVVAPTRLRSGVIQATVVDVLNAADAPLSTSEIRDRVAERLDRAVSQDTVTSFLSVASRATGSPVRRIGRGLYRALG